MKKLLIGLLALGSVSAFAIDCTLTDSNGNIAQFGNPQAWNGPMAGSAKSILSAHGISNISNDLLKKIEPYDLLIQRRSGRDLNALDAGRFFKLVVYRNDKVIASSLAPIEEERAELYISELDMTLECEPTRFPVSSH
jgi:hypothetical protein